MKPRFQNTPESLHQNLRSFLRKRVSDRQDAEDLIQDILLRIHLHVGSLADSEKIGAWTYQIARNAIVDYYRKRGRAISQTEEIQSDTDDEDNVQSEVASWLPEMIRALPSPYQEAVRMTEIDGLTQKQLAEQLGIPLPTAKSRVQRGRQKLKKALLACCNIEIDARKKVISYTKRRR